MPASLQHHQPAQTRQILHPMIERFMSIAPTWLLFDADWAFTRQAVGFLDQCSPIVPVGQLIWIDGTSEMGKDNCAWYRLHGQHTGGPLLKPMGLEKADHRTREQEAIAAWATFCATPFSRAASCWS